MTGIAIGGPYCGTAAGKMNTGGNMSAVIGAGLWLFIAAERLQSEEVV